MQFRVSMIFFTNLLFFMCGIQSAGADGATIRALFADIDVPMGVWIWNTGLITGDTAGYFDFLSENGVDEVYLQIDPDIDMPYYASFMRNAQHAGISVQALGGASSWIKPENLHKLVDFFRFVGEYNFLYPAYTFEAIHLDVEPHGNEEWSTGGKEEMILLFQDMLDQARATADHLGLPLHEDIPFWFDVEICIDASGNERLLSEWVIDLCDGVAVMAYRDQASLILAFTQSEMEYAESLGKRSLRIGIQTARESSANLTFYEEGGLFMASVLITVQASFSLSSNWGFAIHDLGAWMELKPEAAVGK